MWSATSSRNRLDHPMADEYASREPRGSASSIRLNRSVQRLGWMPIRSIATSTVRMTKMARVIRNAVSAETSSGLEEKLDWSRNGGSPGEKTGGAVIDLDLFDNEEGVLRVVVRAILRHCSTVDSRRLAGSGPR